MGPAGAARGAIVRLVTNGCRGGSSVIAGGLPRKGVVERGEFFAAGGVAGVDQEDLFEDGGGGGEVVADEAGSTEVGEHADGPGGAGDGKEVVVGPGNGGGSWGRRRRGGGIAWRGGVCRGIGGGIGTGGGGRVGDSAAAVFRGEDGGGVEDIDEDALGGIAAVGAGVAGGDEMAGESDAVGGEPGAAGGFDEDEGEEDGQAGAPGEDGVDAGVAGIVVVFVAVEAEARGEDVAEGFEGVVIVGHHVADIAGEGIELLKDPDGFEGGGVVGGDGDGGGEDIYAAGPAGVGEAFEGEGMGVGHRHALGVRG